MMNNDMDRVIPLDQLDDFKVADGDPDVRGWEVVSADGRKIGEVDELLIDTDAMKVRYLDVDVDNSMLAGEADRHVLIPIGYARLDRDGDRVLVDSLSATDLGTLPVYTHGPLTRDFETTVRNSFARTGTATAATAADDFYAHDSFDDHRFYEGRRTNAMGDEARMTLSEEELAVGKREISAGEVEIDKHVETEHYASRPRDA